MKINDVTGTRAVNEGHDATPQEKKLAAVGQKIQAALSPKSGITWDDAEFNQAASLGEELTRIGTTFGPRNVKEALANANLTVQQAQAIIDKVIGNS